MTAPHYPNHKVLPQADSLGSATKTQPYQELLLSLNSCLLTKAKRPAPPPREPGVGAQWHREEVSTRGSKEPRPPGRGINRILVRRVGALTKETDMNAEDTPRTGNLTSLT